MPFAGAARRPQVAPRTNKGILVRSQTSSAANYKLNRIKSTVTTITARRRTLAKTPSLFTITRMRKIFYSDARNCNVRSDKQRSLPHSRMRRAGSLARFSLALARVGFIGMLNCCPRRKSASKHGSAYLSSCFFWRIGVTCFSYPVPPAELSSCNS